MPRDNICSECGGAFSDDDMGDGLVCIYCDQGLDSGLPDKGGSSDE